MKLSEVEPLFEKLPVVCQHRVLFGEVDKMNLVYGSHYLTWFEHGRNEYLRRCGLPYTEVEKRGLALPAFEAHVWYLSPVSYDDLVDIRCAVTSCARATALFVFSIECGGRRVAAGYTHHVCLNAERKPVRLPDWLRDAILERY